MSSAGLHEEAMCMIRSLLDRAFGRTTTRFFYSLWIRASGATLVLWAASATVGDSWIAQTGLTLVLVILLVGGIAFFFLGIRDLIRDLRRFRRTRSEKDNHASL
jgi:hypothetical protein